MQKLQLYINQNIDQDLTPIYVRMDLFADESVSITQTIQNVKDIAKIFTEFTQTFSLPASKTNNKLFRHYHNFHIDGTFDGRRKRKAKIELNNIPFKTGFVKLEGVETKNNIAHTYKITFFGNTVNLKDVLGDDELGNLSGLGSLDTDYTYTQVKSKIEATLSGSNLCVPLITHTQQLIYDSAASNAQLGNLYYNSNSSYNANGISWKELKYAIRLQYIIDQIEAQYSEITFSSDFFNNGSATEFYNLWMWLHRKKGNVEAETQLSLVFVTAAPMGIVSGSSGYFSASGNALIYQPLPATYTLETNELTINPSTNATYSVRVLRNGSVYSEASNVTGLQTFFSNVTVPIGSYSIEIASVAGVTFNQFNISWEFTVTITEDDDEPQGGGISGFTIAFKNSQAFTTSTTIPFNISAQIPQIKVIDFLTNIFKMFNLTAFVNEENKIVVQKLDDFYNASSVVHNIDEYVDSTKGTVDVALPFKEIDFSYTGLGTFLAKQYEQLNNRKWGSLDYSDDSSFDGPQNQYKVNVGFEHMQYQNLIDLTTSAVKNIQWGWSVDDNKQSYIGNPLIFYAIEVNNGTNIALRNDSGTIASVNDYIIPSNSLSTNQATSKININFNAEINEYNAENTYASAFTDTLFERNYKTYIQDVFKNKRRLTKVKAYLPLKILYNLKLNDKISLNNNNYRINSITTNLINGESNLELLNIV
jgi:hypothetical protein